MWRLITPTEALLDHNYPCAFRKRDAADIDKQTNVADIVVLGRIYWMPGHDADMKNWFRVIHGSMDGKRRLVICEVDDDTVSPESKAHTRLFHQEWTDDDAEAHRQSIIKAMKHCEAIITTTEPLAELYRQYIGIPVYVLPNSIRWTQWRKCLHSRQVTDIPQGKIVIGWAGGSRVKEDLGPMMEAWKVICERYENVHFVIAGTLNAEYIDMIPRNRITYRKWVAVDFYPIQYAGMDIVCCSIADIPFNRMKSPCKAIEAGAADCAVVASPLVYGEIIDDGKNGFIARSVDDWIRYLTLYIHDEKVRKTHARRWSQRVYQRHNIEKNCWLWANTWRAVMAAGPREYRELAACDMDADSLSRPADLVAV